jgi:LacI family transcriptional regulator
MMSGKSAPMRKTVIPPAGVVGRASTDTLSLDDPQMVPVLRYIREHACDPMQIDDLLSVVPLSRRSMELRFIKAIGRSPHEEIRRVQIHRATRLLAQTHLPLDQVARASGFGGAPMMIRVFRKELGVTPGEHRRRCGTAATAAFV